jgi:glycosyltransferase involved in cell wall biosynthesis
MVLHLIGSSELENAEKLMVSLVWGSEKKRVQLLHGMDVSVCPSFRKVLYTAFVGWDKLLIHSPKSILHLIDSSGVYGAEKVILTLLDESQGSDYPGILGCIREKKTDEVEIAERAGERGIPIHYFTMKRGLNPLGIYEITKFIKHHHISLVHSHGYKTNVFFGILPLRSFPVISTVHGWLKFGTDRKEKVYEFLDSMALKRLNFVVSVSGAVKEDLIKRGISKKNIVTIYNGITTDHFQEKFDGLEIRKKYLLGHGDYVIGTAGRLSEEKGHSYLIRAIPDLAKEIKNIKLIIAGDGPLKEDLECLVDELGVSNHVRLIGYEKDIEKFLSVLDLFILPSLTEGLPISLLEAMASGRAVIASKVGGIKEVIQNSINGILIPPMDVKALSESIKFLFYDSEARRIIGSEGKKHISTHFSSRAMVSGYQNLYDRILSP